MFLRLTPAAVIQVSNQAPVRLTCYARVHVTRSALLQGAQRLVQDILDQRATPDLRARPTGHIAVRPV